MGLMVGLIRILLICAVLLVLPAIAASQPIPPPPPAPPPAPQAPPQLTFSLNQNSLQPGDTHVLRATVSPGDSTLPMDVYLVLQLPDQTMLFYESNGSFTQEAQPLVANWTVTPFSGEVFRYTFSGTEPAGTYTWYAAFTVPGTLNFIGDDLTQVLFTFNTNTPHGKLGPISIRAVYMTDENFTSKTVFAPAARINYHVDVDNTTGSTFPIKIRFEVFANYATKSNLYSYDQTYDVAQMPVGLSRFYNPVNLPSNAAIYWYILRITITPSDCSGTGCTNDGDWGSSTFNIQTTMVPEGKAPNLIVLVHGCCNDVDDVKKDWDTLADEIEKRINPKEWEVVVWDWHEYTPTQYDPITNANLAYQNAMQQGAVLANAIKIYSSKYKYVHFIGHSAGAKLIHEAATAYIYDYFVRQENPFIHLTFLDAYTPSDWDTDSYGSLPTDYPNHFSEHYVDRTDSIIGPWTNSCLSRAFNFDITRWPHTPEENQDFGHQWPHYWYKKSVSTPGFSRFGHPLSFEGGNGNYKELATLPIKGNQCALVNKDTICEPAPCW